MFVERLVGWLETAPENQKVAATRALATAFLTADMTFDEHEIAEATMTVLLDDPSRDVRIALSKGLAHSANAPRHIVLALADDDPEVSIPVLAGSPVILEAELVEHVSKGTPDQQMAVAQREYLAEDVCSAIGQHAEFDPCLAMILNPGARFAPSTFKRLAERFGDIAEMRKCLLARDDVPMDARILLIDKYAVSLLAGETGNDDAGSKKNSRDLQDACDKATITFAAQVGEQDIYEIVIALIESQRLNTAFLLRAICMGNISLFANALSILSKMPLARVERVLADDRRKAFRAIYQRASLPMSAFCVFSDAICSWRNLLAGKDEVDTASLPYRVTREVLANYSGQNGREVDELLLLLRRICTDAARDNARDRFQRINLQLSQSKNLLLEDHVVSTEADVDLSEEDFMQFAVNLADELAEQALAQDKHLQRVESNLEPANEEQGEFTPGLLLNVA